MTRRSPALALALALLLTALSPIAVGAAEAPQPASMAAVGDSITQAASSAGSLGSDAPQNSWSTGTSSTVNSHALRLGITATAYNRSVSGARVADLAGQMQTASGLQPDYLTVLIGGNDLCTDTVSQMTDAGVFGNQFRQAMTTITSLSPETYVYVVSIPNVYQLWQLFRNNWWARFIWATADICQSLLANPTSTQQADVQRRETVRQRNIAYNGQLADVCAQFDRCLFDGNAVFNTPFTTSDVSGDYFHPSVAGQAKLASVSFNAGFSWTSVPPPPPPNQAPLADFGVSCGGLTCSFTDASTDDAGIASRSWAFGDGGTSTEANPSHTYGGAATYDVTLTVTDAAGLTNSVTKPVSVSEPSAATIFVEALDGASVSTGRNTWTATVTVVVADTDGRRVPDATVNATWSSGGAVTCVTDQEGSCSVTSGNLNKRKVASVELRVDGVLHATLAYDEASSLLTRIVVNQP